MTKSSTPKIHGPDRPCYFAVGDLVTCAGPFNSGRDDQGYWRRVDRVTGIRWDAPFRSGRRTYLGFWRVAVPGFSGPDRDISPAPDGAAEGDIIRIGTGG